jgi:hypothetical protein
MSITKANMFEAQTIASRIPTVLEQRGLEPAFSDWLITEDRGLVVLFGVLDVQQIQRLEQYTHAPLIHHISTAIGGRPIEISNSSGLRYAVLLSKPPRLPRSINFPGLRRGYVRLGMRFTGEPVEISWASLGHALVAGMTRSGKSSFDRLLVYQALAEGFQILLGDLDGVTFPMLADHPALLSPIANSPAEMLEIVERALGECDHRQEIYDQAPGYPEKLDEYNRIARDNGLTPVPRLLVILDEFNAAVSAAGGHRGPLATRVAELGWRAQKFGVSLVLSAQDFAKATVGRVRDQMQTTVCFRVRGESVARNVGCGEAARIPAGRPGLAVTDRWGPAQMYHLPKDLLIRIGEGQPRDTFNEDEQRMITHSLQEEDGRMSIPLLEAFGLSTWKARQLLEDWELRGWVKKDPQRDNARYITPKLLDLAGLRRIEGGLSGFEAV